MYIKRKSEYYNGIAANSDDTILIDIYADEGITGTSTDKREEFNRMMNDARKHKFDRVIVKSVTRFARNTKDCLEAVRELKHLGISVYFEENNIDTNKTEGETLITLLGMVAQNESLSISKNMRWGIQKRMQHGTYITSSAPFGYDYQEKQITINVSDAQIIKQIYDLYLAGNGIDAITKILTEQTQRKWYFSTVRYILRNEKYIGDSIYQKTYTSEMLPFERQLNNGKKEKYYVEDTHEKIIDEDTFSKVQKLINSRQRVCTRQKRLFTDLIVCGQCGRSFRRTVKNYKSDQIIADAQDEKNRLISEGRQEKEKLISEGKQVRNAFKANPSDKFRKIINLLGSIKDNHPSDKQLSELSKNLDNQNSMGQPINQHEPYAEYYEQMRMEFSTTHLY